jgi:hypothetical protein
MLSDEEGNHLREAILLQRARTPSHASVIASAYTQMVLHTYCDYLRGLPTTPERQATIEAIQRGNATLKNSQYSALMISLKHIESWVMTISDLSLLILRNQTAVPFIMGDAPCVFSNHYMRDIRNSGILGFTTPGLMVALPIDWRTQILFYDATVYQSDYSTAGYIDIFRIGDISLLNPYKSTQLKRTFTFLTKVLRTTFPNCYQHTASFSRTIRVSLSLTIPARS